MTYDGGRKPIGAAKSLKVGCRGMESLNFYFDSGAEYARLGGQKRLVWDLL